MPCALTLCASNGARVHAKFVHVKINACLELALVSNKRRVNRLLKKIDARVFNRGYTVHENSLAWSTTEERKERKRKGPERKHECSEDEINVLFQALVSLRGYCVLTLGDNA